MTSHRKIFPTLTILAVLAAAAPSFAGANSLLSGYGAPGEGNQAILGSALVGGGGGGGSSSGGPSGGGSRTSLSGTAGDGAQGSQSNSVSTTSGGEGARTGAGGGRAAGKGASSLPRHGGGGTSKREASKSAAHAYPNLSRDSALPSSSVATETLGLSGEYLACIILALGALVFTGVATRRLTRTSHPPEGP